MTADAPLALQHQEHVIFRDRSFSWVDLSLFSLHSDATIEPIRALSTLLRDSRYYLNRYDTADNAPADEAWPGRDGEPDVHGPYLMSAISETAFTQIDGPAACRALLEWIGEEPDNYPAPGQIEGDLDAILRHLEQAPVAFELAELGDKAHQEIWYLTDPFFEIVTVDLAALTVGLVAAGTD